MGVGGFQGVFYVGWHNTSCRRLLTLKCIPRPIRSMLFGTEEKDEGGNLSWCWIGSLVELNTPSLLFLPWTSIMIDLKFPVQEYFLLTCNSVWTEARLSRWSGTWQALIWWLGTGRSLKSVFVNSCINLAGSSSSLRFVTKIECNGSGDTFPKEWENTTWAGRQGIEILF